MTFDPEISGRPTRHGDYDVNTASPDMNIPGLGDIYTVCMTRAQEPNKPEDTPRGTSFVSGLHGQTGDYLMFRNIGGGVVGVVCDPVSSDRDSPWLTSRFIYQVYNAIRDKTRADEAYMAINGEAIRTNQDLAKQRGRDIGGASFTLGSFHLSPLTGLDMDMLGDVVLYVEGDGFIPAGQDYNYKDFGDNYDYPTGKKFAPHQIGYEDIRIYHVHLDPARLSGKRVLIGTDAYRKAVGLRDGQGPVRGSYSQIEDCLRSPNPAKALQDFAAGVDDQACIVIKVDKNLVTRTPDQRNLTQPTVRPLKPDPDATVPRPARTPAGQLNMQAAVLQNSQAAGVAETKLIQPLVLEVGKKIDLIEELGRRGWSFYHNWSGQSGTDDDIYYFQMKQGEIKHPDLTVFADAVVASNDQAALESSVRAKELLNGSAEGVVIVREGDNTRLTLGRGDMVVFQIDDLETGINVTPLLVS